VASRGHRVVEDDLRSIDRLKTEGVNPATVEIDEWSAWDIVMAMNAEDATVATAVRRELISIARAIEGIADRLRRGGRLIYVGAGTSGRLGVLDASECPPTFGTSPEQVVGLIAGGPSALTWAAEGVEDSAETGRDDAARLTIAWADAVVGITASGRTPYVLGAIDRANEVGAFTVGLACNDLSPLGRRVREMICPVVGPEVIAGSTRLKAGTAQKMVLNMLSTGTMILLGKTFGNLMVDVQASNAKLRRRAVAIVRTATGLDEPAAETLLAACGGETKTAIVAALANVDPTEARTRLARAGGLVRAAIGGTTP
jgi:N-acetylmuramic acid 6-phosphate etherase